MLKCKLISSLHISLSMNSSQISKLFFFLSCPTPREPKQTETIKFGCFSWYISVYFFIFCIIFSLYAMASNDNETPTSIPYKERIEEASYFNWKCAICSDIAMSAMYLQDQFMVRHGIYVDYNGEHWRKCVKCETPYHVKCLQERIPISVWQYVCRFMGCRQEDMRDKIDRNQK